MLPADYARVVQRLSRSQLPAYISFVEHGFERGLALRGRISQRIWVRTSPEAIVKSELLDEDGDVRDLRNADPFAKTSPFFF